MEFVYAFVLTANGLLICAEMALMQKLFSARTKLIKKAQNLPKSPSAIFEQICCYKPFIFVSIVSVR